MFGERAFKDPQVFDARASVGLSLSVRTPRGWEQPSISGLLSESQCTPLLLTPAGV